MLITTIYGEMDEALLTRSDGMDDTENARARWVEYRIIGKDEIVHRSVAIEFKTPLGEL